MFTRYTKIDGKRSRAAAGRSPHGNSPGSGTFGIEDNRRLKSDSVNTEAIIVQRQEVDTSSSPSLPEYEKGETPAWKQERGVPQWARDQYCKDAKRNLIASVSKGKIGSIYFKDSRIRTTHFAGPAKESHKGDKTLQFNIDIKSAEAEFKRANPRIRDHIRAQIDTNLSRKKQQSQLFKLYYSIFDQWIAEQLKSSAVDAVPSWATQVTSPEKAIDLEQEAPSASTILFEVFVSVSGEVQGWHPSRGVAAKFATNKQVISVLNAALKNLEKDKITDPGARNKAFYEFIKRRLPDFVAQIRAPKEI